MSYDFIIFGTSCLSWKGNNNTLFLRCAAQHDASYHSRHDSRNGIEYELRLFLAALYWQSGRLNSRTRRKKNISKNHQKKNVINFRKLRFIWGGDILFPIFRSLFEQSYDRFSILLVCRKRHQHHTVLRMNCTTRGPMSQRDTLRKGRYCEHASLHRGWHN